MSLKTTYTSANLQLSRGLSIRYKVDLVDYSWYRVTRMATKSYSYVGMTQAAANLCRAAKLAQYTRRHLKLNSKNDGSTILPESVEFVECMATVNVSPLHGDSWQCAIDVNETDIAASTTAPSDPADLFVDFALYDYDEPNANLLSISSITVLDGSTAIISYSSAMRIPDYSAIRVYHRTPTAISDWQQVPVTFATSSTLTAESANVHLGDVFRIKYGNITSAPYST